MIFRFLIVSDEVENFRREIKIDSDDTFHDLFKAIVKSVNYREDEMASFFICEHNWRRKEEITLVEMDTESDEDSYTMEEAVLSDFLEDEKEKLMFVFDYVNDRALYIELSEIIPEKSSRKAVCSISTGEAPPQSITIEDDLPADTVGNDFGDTFFGDEDFNIDELDSDGFESHDDISVNLGESDNF